MTKQELRKELREKRNKLPNHETASMQIAEQIISSYFFQEATTVMLYRSVNSEVITDFLWKKCSEH